MDMANPYRPQLRPNGEWSFRPANDRAWTAVLVPGSRPGVREPRGRGHGVGKTASVHRLPAGWGALRPGDRFVDSGDRAAPDTILVHQGRRIAIVGPRCLAAWLEDPARYFKHLQGYGALIDERQVTGVVALGPAWFWSGSYLLLGLICGPAGASCGPGSGIILASATHGEKKSQ